MRRNIHFLVKNSPQTPTNTAVSQPSKASFPTTNHSMGVREQKTSRSPPGKLEASRRNIEGYIQSCGGVMWQGGMSAERVQSLVDESGDVSIRDELGWSLLHYAANSRPLSSVKRLLALHADPNVACCLGRTPLHQAAMRDDAEVVAELLAYGACLNTGDSDGWTPVHFAVHLGCIKALTAMSAYRPDFTLPNHAFRTPKDLAPDETISQLIVYLETHTNDHSRPSLNSTNTSDSSLSECHAEIAARYKADSKPHFPLRDLSPTLVRTQRPNEESGAIVCPHPKSAYS